MLKAWTEILPVFIHRWLAMRQCQRITIGYTLRVAHARDDLLYIVPKEKD